MLCRTMCFGTKIIERSESDAYLRMGTVTYIRMTDADNRQKVTVLNWKVQFSCKL